ncbi:MAG TPA: divergent PAP2 family protein [Alphaproteobacteria bacterium]|nr:divergent PAP2 family protein [Alphaproteobacteria bacterium]
MDIVKELLLNYYFLGFVSAWVVATLLKAFLHSANHGLKFSLKHGMQNGGMPSGHTTVVSTLTFGLLFRTGFSDLFFASLIFSSIIIMDAFRVRKNIGIQGDKLNELLKEFNEKPIQVVYGHSFTQVLAGLILGLTLAFSWNLVLF